MRPRFLIPLACLTATCTAYPFCWRSPTPPCKCPPLDNCNILCDKETEYAWCQCPVGYCDCHCVSKIETMNTTTTMYYTPQPTDLVLEEIAKRNKHDDETLTGIDSEAASTGPVAVTTSTGLESKVSSSGAEVETSTSEMPTITSFAASKRDTSRHVGTMTDKKWISYYDAKWSKWAVEHNHTFTSITVGTEVMGGYCSNGVFTCQKTDPAGWCGCSYNSDVTLHDIGETELLARTLPSQDRKARRSVYHRTSPASDVPANPTDILEIPAVASQSIVSTTPSLSLLPSLGYDIWPPNATSLVEYIKSSKLSVAIENHFTPTTIVIGGHTIPGYCSGGTYTCDLLDPPGACYCSLDPGHTLVGERGYETDLVARKLITRKGRRTAHPILHRRSPATNVPANPTAVPQTSHRALHSRRTVYYHHTPSNIPAHPTASPLHRRTAAKSACAPSENLICHPLSNGDYDCKCSSMPKSSTTTKTTSTLTIGFDGDPVPWVPPVTHTYRSEDQKILDSIAFSVTSSSKWKGNQKCIFYTLPTTSDVPWGLKTTTED